MAGYPAGIDYEEKPLTQGRRRVQATRLNVPFIVAGRRWTSGTGRSEDTARLEIVQYTVHDTVYQIISRVSIGATGRDVMLMTVQDLRSAKHQAGQLLKAAIGQTPGGALVFATNDFEHHVAIVRRAYKEAGVRL